MDALAQEFPNSMNSFKFDRGPISFPSNSNHLNGYNLNHNSSNPNPYLHSINPYPPEELTSSASSLGSDGDDPNSNAILKYISDMLMEEDLEGKNCMLQDCLALQAAEKSFYDVLGQDYPHSLSQFSSCSNQNVESPDESFTWRSSDESTDSSNNYPTASPLLQKSSRVFEQADLNLSWLQTFLVNSPESTLLGPDFPGDLQPFGVVKSAGKSLSDGDSLILVPKSNASKLLDEEERDFSLTGSRGRKSHQRDDSDDMEEERSNKHSALSLAETEHTDLFDEVLLCPVERNEPSPCARPLPDRTQDGTSENGQIKGSKGRRAKSKKRGNRGELVDLWTLLTQCAQAVAGSDQRTANDLLKQIRQHSSDFGDGNQRLAHYFANALETRLAGVRTPKYSPIISNKTPVTDILKAYQVYVRACPFKRMSHFFANRTIIKLAEKAARLHVIDFGILYGFQWPCLIQRLSQRPGGPPKLHITGIELPQPGFRPAERVEETVHRLARYCERFNVPFEFTVIAQKWETIKYEDLNIDRDEMTVVNCLYRLRNLPDDTLVPNSARDTVLRLIEKIKPDIFIHGVVNGTYNAPFFVTRFREALFHFSSLFDMFAANVPCEDEQRRLFEKEIHGKDVMNVIACEGAERVERPETYRQWQVRNQRAGFRQLPLDQELLKKVMCTVKSEYNKDFVVDEDGRWMLQGWKGRIIHALSVWKPVRE